jgi:hypothetical protein
VRRVLAGIIGPAAVDKLGIPLRQNDELMADEVHGLQADFGRLV